MGLLYHGSGALASYSVEGLPERPGEALVRSGGRFPYSHVLPSMHQDVARKLDDLFKE